MWQNFLFIIYRALESSSFLQLIYLHMSSSDMTLEPCDTLPAQHSLSHLAMYRPLKKDI